MVGFVPMELLCEQDRLQLGWFRALGPTYDIPGIYMVD
jgi:hypothetical protein